MLLSLLIATVILISGITLTAMLSTGDIERQQPAQPMILSDQEVSLGSFILLLFSPTTSEYSKPNQFSDQR